MDDEKVIPDAESLRRFREATGQLEVCDPQGRMLGYFLPPDLYREFVYAWARAQFADETVLEAVRNESGGFTTPEALARLSEVAKLGRRAS